MFALIALAVVVILALAVLVAVAHVLFSPWLLLAVVAVLAWVKFGPRRSRR